MLSNEVREGFLNTYFKDDEKVFVSELYDKWKRKAPKVLRKSYTRDEAIKNHEEIVRQIESRSISA